MSDKELLPAPEIERPRQHDPTWEREYRAFVQLKPSLLASHAGKYVAIHEGQVVDSGEDQVAVALRAYSKYGYVPIYVGLVSDEPQSVVRIPSPRLRASD